MISEKAIAAWPKAKQDPVDVTIQLRNFFGAVVSRHTGETREFSAPTTNLDTAKQAKAAMQTALLETVGKEKISSLGIKLELRESRIDLRKAYSPDGKPIYLTNGQPASVSIQDADLKQINDLIRAAQKQAAKNPGQEPSEIDKKMGALLENSDELALEMAGKQATMALEKMLDSHFAANWEGIAKERAKYGVYPNGPEVKNIDPNNLKPSFDRKDVVIRRHVGTNYSVELEVPKGTTLSPVLAQALFTKMNEYLANIGKPAVQEPNPIGRWYELLAEAKAAQRTPPRGMATLQIDGNNNLSYSGPAL